MFACRLETVCTCLLFLLTLPHRLAAAPAFFGAPVNIILVRLVSRFSFDLHLTNRSNWPIFPATARECEHICFPRHWGQLASHSTFPVGFTTTKCGLPEWLSTMKLSSCFPLPGAETIASEPLSRSFLALKKTAVITLTFLIQKEC